MENVNTEVTKITPCKTKIKFVVNKSLVDKYTEETYFEIQKEAIIPGFRKGSVPIDILKTRYENYAREKIVNKILDNTIPTVLKEKNINCIMDSLKIDSMDFQPEKNCVYELTLETEPEFKLKSYKGLKLKKEIRKVVQKDIDSAIEQLQQHNARIESSKKEFISTDDTKPNSNIFCVVNYKIFSDGKELKDMEGNNILMDISNDRLPVGLKEGIAGMKKGETKKIKVTFPANFPRPELISKEVEMELTIIEIKEKIFPNIDDEFAKDVGYKSLIDLHNAIRQSLQQQFDKESEEKLKEQVFEHLLKEHNFPLPETEVKNRNQEILDSLKKDFISRGVKEEDFKLTTEEQDNILKRAEKDIKLKYILRKIIHEEKIEVTKEELEKEKGKLAVLYPGKEKALDQYFENNIDHFVSNILENKLFEMIFTNSKIKEVDVTQK